MLQSWHNFFFAWTGACARIWRGPAAGPGRPINTHCVLFAAGSGAGSVPPGPVSIFTSLLNLLLFGFLVKILCSIAVKKGDAPREELPARLGAEF